MNMGYLIARKISLSILRTNAKIKNGIETKVAVEARGSLFSKATTKATIISVNDIKRVNPFPNIIGNILSPDDESSTISGKIVSKETDEKQNPYGSNKASIEISNGIIAELDWFCITSPQPMENKIIPTIELANHPKMGFPFQLYGL